MQDLDLVEEADHCRNLAKVICAEPDHGFLLKLATAFEQLAQSQGGRNKPGRASSHCIFDC